MEPARERRLFIGDKKNQRCFRAPAGKVGCINNLYTVIGNTDQQNSIDQTWTAYERKLPVAIDKLIHGTVDAETWVRVLIPFVACMLVRDPEFVNQFNQRIRPFLDQVPPDFKFNAQDNANEARLIDLQRLLGSVVAAKWTVLITDGQEELITNDLGYAAFAHPATGSRGMAIPLDRRFVLLITPLMEDKPILYAKDDKWVPIVEYGSVPSGAQDGLNVALASIALRFIFGSNKSIVNKYFQGVSPVPTSLEAELLGFPEKLRSPAFEFTWHRLVGAIRKPPSEKDGWNFPLDVEALAEGWCPRVAFPHQPCSISTGVAED